MINFVWIINKKDTLNCTRTLENKVNFNSENLVQNLKFKKVMLKKGKTRQNLIKLNFEFFEKPVDKMRRKNQLLFSNFKPIGKING